MMLRKMNRKVRGQGMTEYTIVVALIAIGTIAVVTIFGDNIRDLFSTSAQALSGQNATRAPVLRNTAKDTANLNTFDESSRR